MASFVILPWMSSPEENWSSGFFSLLMLVLNELLTDKLKLALGYGYGYGISS